MKKYKSTKVERLKSLKVQKILSVCAVIQKCRNVEILK